jgi:hypothetical protein
VLADLFLAAASTAKRTEPMTLLDSVDDARSETEWARKLPFALFFDFFFCLYAMRVMSTALSSP